MLKISGLFLLVLVSVLAASCATTYQENNKINHEPGALDLILCEEPRPQACTHEYDPVCATLSDGGSKTHSTGCSSCADPEVVGYKPGVCGIVSLD